MRMKSLCKKIKVILLVVFLSFQFCLINQASAQSESMITMETKLDLSKDEKKILSKLRYQANLATGEQRSGAYTIGDLYYVFDYAQDREAQILSRIASDYGLISFPY